VTPPVPEPESDFEIPDLSRGAWGIGLATVTADGEILDTWYPEPFLGVHRAARIAEEVGYQGGSKTFPTDRGHAFRVLKVDLTHLTGPDEARRVDRVAVATFIEDLAAPPVDPHDAYLRLHLLSSRLVRPHGLNLEGLFGILTNAVWTNHGPCAVEDFERTRLRLRSTGQHVTVHGIDKFPRMVDYVVPSGVRIAEADRVRLGAHLAPGTTVMHEGFCNFNAGTLGASMVEGRISAGVVVGDGTDIGGGASIMGTLSGGGKQVISIGERCLLGANAGIGISLGDDCVVEAGCYITAGTKVTVADANPAHSRTQVIKAVELSGASNVLFRRNSVTGAIEAVPWKSSGIELNAALHAN